MDEVKLISVTPDAEKIILYIARVSSDQSNESTGLVKYLIRNKEWSPFEQAYMTLEIITSRAIATQMLRHRSFTFQEFSQRYASPDSFEMYQARRQAENNRQSSIDDLDQQTKRWWNQTQEDVWENAMLLYEQALSVGIAKECARMILPLNTTTRLYMTGSLRSWIHYFELRCKENTQLEHRELAEEARTIFAEQFPTISEALYGD